MKKIHKVLLPVTIRMLTYKYKKKKNFYILEVYILDGMFHVYVCVYYLVVTECLNSKTSCALCGLYHLALYPAKFLLWVSLFNSYTWISGCLSQFYPNIFLFRICVLQISSYYLVPFLANKELKENPIANLFLLYF